MKKKTKQLPAPIGDGWRVIKQPCFGNPDPFCIIGADHNRIADVADYDGAGEARAQLMATAPQLSNACQMVLDRWNHGNLGEAARACANALYESHLPLTIEPRLAPCPTPEPWSVVQKLGEDCLHIEPGIATVHGIGGIPQANANAIACVPVLIKTLERIRTICMQTGAPAFTPEILNLTNIALVKARLAR